MLDFNPVLFLRYVLVGASNTLFSYAIIFGCMYLAGMSTTISNIVGYIFGLITSYTLNRIYTFKSTQKIGGEIARFLSIFLIAFGGNFVTLILLTEAFHLHAAISQLLAGVVYVLISFYLNRFLVFTPRNSKS
jgi:putative flippase GtrA